MVTTRPILASDVLPAAVAFATAVPLDGSKTMARTFVASALTFTVGATANGGACVLPLIADGQNMPTFTGFTEAGTSSGFLNTYGILNMIQFFYLDGTPYYSVSQAVNAQPIYQPATRYSMAGPASGSVGSAITITLQTAGTLASAVVVTPSDGGGGGTFNPTTVTLPVATGGPSTATFTYTPASAGTKTISATNNGGLTNPASLSISVSSAATQKNIRLSQFGSSVTETTDGSGYDYSAPSNPGYGSGGAAISSVAVPANADGFFGGKTQAASPAGFMVGFKSGSTNGSFPDILYGLFCDPSGSSGNWLWCAGGTTGSSTTPIATNDIGRIRRSGTTVIAEVSKDNGSTWTTIKTWTGASTAALYGQYVIASSNALLLPFSSANAV